jgi:hypothetical protein
MGAEQGEQGGQGAAGSPMTMPLTREYVLAMIEARLANNPPDAWILTIERDALIAIGQQSSRQGW